MHRISSLESGQQETEKTVAIQLSRVSPTRMQHAEAKTGAGSASRCELFPAEATDERDRSWETRIGDGQSSQASPNTRERDRERERGDESENDGINYFAFFGSQG